MLKKIASILLVAVFVLTAIPFSASAADSTTVTADGINAYRGSGQLIIYTPAMGETTKTNEWGNEVVIVDNIATEYNTGDSPIPENGFVLSGHNSDDVEKQMGKWIDTNIPLGAHVYFDCYGVITVSDNAFAGDYTHDYNAVNAVRDTDNMIIYTKRGSTTGTNEWGYEAVVSEGVVVSVGGNNSTVPEAGNSFVVSAHGSAAKWLKASAMIGMSVAYNPDNKLVTFSYNGESLAYSVDYARNSALAAKREAENSGFFFSETATERFSEVEKAYFAANGSYDRASAERLIADYKYASSLFCDSAASEYRGVWVRPTQTSLAEVRSFIKQLYDSGINMVSVETMYHGTMIYPTAKGSLFEHNPIFNGFDVLGAYVQVCHEYGMELHCWMPVFYSCSTDASNWKLSPAYKKPEWCLKTNNGSTLYSGDKDGMVFLNPALDEVRDFLAETYTHLLKTYDIDGFQLDYIRYREGKGKDDYGYDAATVAKFRQAYPAYRDYIITYNTKAAYWNDWVAFRAQQVTGFVGRMRGIIDEIAPNVVLSADVGPVPSSAYRSLYQDSIQWLKNGWLDLLHPMAYGEGYAPTMKELVALAGDDCVVVPGLGAFVSEFDASDLARQTAEMSEAGCGGVVYFEASAFLKKGCGNILTDSLFSEKTVVPSADNDATARAWLERFLYRIDFARSNGNLSDAQTSSLSALAEAALSETAAGGAGSAYQTLVSLRVSVASLAPEGLKSRLTDDITGAVHAACRSLADHSALLRNCLVLNGDDAGYVVIGNGKALLSVNGLTALLPGSRVEKNGKTVSEPDPITTGMTLANRKRTFTIVQIGDVDCNGKLNSADYALIKRSCLGTYSLSGASAVAADVNCNGKIDSSDYALAKRHVLGTYSIYN